MMPVSEPTVLEETLDPQDWSELRGLAHRMVDDMFEWMENARNRPAWQVIPRDVRARFRRPLPWQPESPESIYRDFRESVLPYPTGNAHPRFWAYVMGSGSPMGMLAELLAAGMNCNTFGGDQIAIEVETQVLDWCKQMFGFPAESSGILVSGGSSGNLVGLTVARNAQAEFRLAEEGLHGAPRRMIVYASTEAHNSFVKAVELLGLGGASLRRIPVDRDYAMDVEALRAAISGDRARGHLPFCVAGNAGTVNTGAFDPLHQLAELCAQHKLWFHVDGAFGACAALAPSLRHNVRGLERADSLAVSLHKWLHVPYGAGCVLVRHPGQHRRAFHSTASYLTGAERGLAGGQTWFKDYGFELSRGFLALKAWMAFRENGVEKLGRLVEQNVRQAQYLAGRVQAEPELELLAPVPLNIVCFRYVRPDLNAGELDLLNRDLLGRLHESGVAVPSSTVLNGKFAIRVCITNHRSRQEDFDELIREVLRLGREIAL